MIILSFYSTIFIFMRGASDIKDIKLYENIPNQRDRISICYNEQNPCNFPQHWHEHIELHYVVKGNSRVRCGEDVIELSAGELAVINANELHKGEGGMCDYICFIVSPSFFEHCPSIFQKKICDKHVSKIIEDVYKYHTRGSQTDLLEIQGNMCFLFSYLIKNYTVRSMGESSYSGYINKLKRVNEITDYMSKNYDKPLSTHALAKRAYLSEGYFCKIFKEVTGRTVMEYLSRLRIDSAYTMLTNTSMSITEVAFLCGFDDVNYFSRTYKKIKGVSPQASRQLAKEM